jgi:hypothetical protein
MGNVHRLVDLTVPFNSTKVFDGTICVIYSSVYEYNSRDDNTEDIVVFKCWHCDDEDASTEIRTRAYYYGDEINDVWLWNVHYKCRHIPTDFGHVSWAIRPVAKGESNE